MPTTSTFVSLNFNPFLKINYSNIIHFCLICYRVEKENKLTCYGCDSTKQYTSWCKHPSQKGNLLYESLSHSMSCVKRGHLCLRCLIMVSTQRHCLLMLIIYATRRTNNAPIYGSLSKTNLIKKIILSLYSILKNSTAPFIYRSLLKTIFITVPLLFYTIKFFNLTLPFP